MCGIAGFAGFFIPGLIARMNRAQAHRGPDGEGCFEDAVAGIGLGHVRLAILDLSPTGAQPMVSTDGRLVIVFNGEIYNFRELRADLEKRGHTFRSSGDTAVLLAGWHEYGPEFLPALNGMFAFALWDCREHELWLVRDPIGIKPLYVAQPAEGQLVFASELKALFAHPQLRREPDFEVLNQHLTYGHSTTHRTALRGVERMPPGAAWRVRPGRGPSGFIDQRHFAAIDFTEQAPPACSSRAVATELLADLTAAVSRQLVADVPVGLFFSGGLDSTLIAALATQLAPATARPLPAYTITYSESENRVDRYPSDANYARQYAASLEVKWHEFVLAPTVADLLPTLIWHLDEPLADPATIASYLVCHLARQQRVPVVLSGQGADELFGGYTRHVAWRLLRNWPRPVRQLMATIGAMLPGAWSGHVGAWLRRVRRLLQSCTLSDDERFVALCMNVPADQAWQLWSPLVISPANPALPDLTRLSGLTGSPLSRYLARDFSVYLPNHNLLYTDKTAMAVGIEARVPYLDLPLVRRAAQWPIGVKVHGAQTKMVLRAAARLSGRVPRGIITRAKAGFGAPYRKWLRFDLAQMWHDLLSPAAIRRRGWFEVSAVQRIRDVSQRGQMDLYMLQWALMTMELWARAFLDRNPADSPLSPPVVANPMRGRPH